MSVLSNPMPPRDLAALLRLIEAGPLCNPRQSREIASAIRSAGDWLDTPLERLPTDPPALRRHLAQLHPEALGVSAARVANVRSLLNRGLKLAGVKPANRPVAEALSPAWKTLFVELETELYIRSSLAPFARFCSDVGVEPGAVSDAVAARYLDHLERFALVAKPATTHQTVCRAWSQAGARIAGWPDSILTVPRYAKTYTLPLSDFPMSFQQDLEVYLARLALAQPGDLFDETAPLRPLKPSSIKTKRYQIRQFASALVLTGVPIEAIGSLAALVTTEHVKAGITFFHQRDRADPTNTRTVALIADTLRAVAKYHVGLPAEQLVLLTQVKAKLSVNLPGMCEAKRRRLAQLDDPAVRERFLHYPPAEMMRLAGKTAPTRQDALTYSLLLAIEILLHAPMRIGNLAGLRLDTQIILPRSAGGGAVLLISPPGVKNAEPLRYLLTPETTRYLEIYLTVFRPRLETDEGAPCLFPGRSGRCKRPDTLSKQIHRYLGAKLGLDLWPHDIRDFVATCLLEHNPGDYETPRRLLGHRDQATTHQRYQGSEIASAARLQANLLRDARRYTSALAPISAAAVDRSNLPPRKRQRQRTER